MKNFLFVTLLVFAFQNVNAQDTLSVEMYKNNYTQTKNIKKATFAFYKIVNEDGSLSTIKYSFVDKIILSSETIKDGEPFGIWFSEWTKKSSDYSFIMKYYDPNEVEDVVDEDDIKKMSDSDKFVEAEPIGGDSEINKILFTVDYPQIAIDNDIEGKVLIRVVINEKGSPCDFTVFKSIDKFLDKSAMKTVIKIPNFNPATLNGTPVKSSVIIPIVFKLG